MKFKPYKVNYEKLRNILKERNIKHYILCNDLGIDRSNLSKALNGHTPFFPRWRKLISEYLALPERELFPDYFEKGAN